MILLHLTIEQAFDSNMPVILTHSRPVTIGVDTVQNGSSLGILLMHYDLRFAPYRQSCDMSFAILVMSISKLES
jgi:hypothetical protein